MTRCLRRQDLDSGGYDGPELEPAIGIGNRRRVKPLAAPAVGTQPHSRPSKRLAPFVHHPSLDRDAPGELGHDALATELLSGRRVKMPIDKGINVVGMRSQDVDPRPTLGQFTAHPAPLSVGYHLEIEAGEIFGGGVLA